MKRLVFAFALLALLAVPAPAMAKVLTNVSVCGPDACAAITGETNLHNFGAGGEPDGSSARAGTLLRDPVHGRRRGRKPPVVGLVRPLGEEAGDGRREDGGCLGAARRAEARCPREEPEAVRTARDQLGHHRLSEGHRQSGFVPQPLSRSSRPARLCRRGSPTGSPSSSRQRARRRGRWSRPACSIHRPTACSSAVSRS